MSNSYEGVFMKINSNEIIRCPVCGAEYLPGEIYLPKCFLGQPEYVQRNNDNRIIDCFGNYATMGLVEHYCCDYCESNFKVFGKVRFFTQQEE